MDGGRAGALQAACLPVHGGVFLPRPVILFLGDQTQFIADGGKPPVGWRSGPCLWTSTICPSRACAWRPGRSWPRSAPKTWGRRAGCPGCGQIRPVRVEGGQVGVAQPGAAKQVGQPGPVLHGGLSPLFQQGGQLRGGGRAGALQAADLPVYSGVFLPHRFVSLPGPGERRDDPVRLRHRVRLRGPHRPGSHPGGESGPRPVRGPTPSMVPS